MIISHPLSKHPMAYLNFDWFQNNLLKSNTEKCHLLVITNDRVSVNVDRSKIDKSYTEKLLGVTFDRKLTLMITFLTSVIPTLARVTPYMDTAKKCILMNAYFNLQFSYFPLAWM